MRANRHKKTAAWVRDLRPKSKAAESQSARRDQQRARGRDQLNVTTTTDPEKRKTMRACIHAIEFDEQRAAALQAILDRPEIAALVRRIRSDDVVEDTADASSKPEGLHKEEYTCGQVAELVDALLDDQPLGELVRDIIKLDSTLVAAVVQALTLRHGLQLLARIARLDVDEQLGLATILDHHECGFLLKHCERRGVGAELLIGIHHPDAPALGRKLQQLPPVLRWFFGRVSDKFG
jgi:hypothetical protein